MKNGLKIGLVCLAALFLAAGCSDKVEQGKYTAEQMKTIPYPDRYNLPTPAGGMSLNVESETITVKDLTIQLEERLKPMAQKSTPTTFNQAARPAFREALRNHVTDILLYREAKKQAPESIDDALDKAVESEMSRFMASYGNNRAMAESALQSMGYDWKTFRDFQRRMILTQSYLSKEFNDKRPVSHSEMMDYYNQHKDQFCKEGFVQFRLIDIIPDKIPAELRQPDETSQQAAERLVAQILDQLKTGEDFGTLAKKYSQGPLASAGGLWRQITIGAGSLPSPYEILEEKAIALEPGQVDQPLTVKDHIFILKLENKIIASCTPFDEVQDAIEQQFQFEFRREQYMKLVDRLASRIDILLMEQFVDQSVKEAYAMWNQGK